MTYVNLENFFSDAWGAADTAEAQWASFWGNYDLVLGWLFPKAQRKYFTSGLDFSKVSNKTGTVNAGCLEAERQWNDLYAGTHEAIESIDPTGPSADAELLTIIGISLHKVQDFYAHTSWADRSFHDYTWFDEPDAQKLHCDLDGYGPEHQEVDNPGQNPAYYEIAYREGFYATWQWVKQLRSWAYLKSPTLWTKASQLACPQEVRDEWKYWRAIPNLSGDGWKGPTNGADICGLLDAVPGYTSRYIYAFPWTDPQLRPWYVKIWERFAPVIFDPLVQDPSKRIEAPETLSMVPRQRWLSLATDWVGEAHSEHATAIDSGKVNGAQIPDFFAWISVNGKWSFQPMYLNRDDFRPTQWLLLVPVDPWNPSLDITYQLWDDDYPFDANDHCNIAPGTPIDWKWKGTLDTIPADVETQGYHDEGNDENGEGNADEAYVHLKLSESVNHPPHAELDKLGYVAKEGEPIVFSAQGSYDPDNPKKFWYPGPLAYMWDFDSLTPEWDTGWLYSSGLMSHTYHDDCFTGVKVWVWDGEPFGKPLPPGDETAAIVSVENVAPSVYAGPDIYTESVIEKPVVLSGSFTDPGLDDTHTIWWDFGDGEPAAYGSLLVAHTYEPGVYMATLHVVDDDQGHGFDDVTVVVGGSAPSFHAVDDEYTARDDQVLTLTDFNQGVMGNDVTGRGGADASIVSQPMQGSVQMNQDGTFTFTPLRDGRTPVTFTYMISRGEYLSIGTVTINLVHPNDPPTVWDAYFTVEKGTTLQVGRPGLLEGASDPEGDPLTAEIVQMPAHGSATVDAGGSFTYTPDASRYTSDAFTFRATDGHNYSNTATVYISLSRANTSPETVADSYTTNEDCVLVVSDPAQGLLGNDTDNEGDGQLTVLPCSLSLQISVGDVTWNPDGTFAYTPPRDFCGQDKFLYWLDDGTYCSFAEVTVDVLVVNDPPTITVEPVEQTVQYSDPSADIHALAYDPDSLSVGITTSGLPANIAQYFFAQVLGPPAQYDSRYAGTLDVPAGVYPATFTASDGELTTSVVHTVTVTPEDATVNSLEAPVAMEVPVAATAAPTVAGTIAQADDGHPGVLSRAVVKVSLVPVGPGSTITKTALLTVDAGGMTGSFSAGFTGVPVNCYSVYAWVEGGYFTSPKVEELMAVYSPGAGFASGGGWFYWPGTSDKTTFGFVTNYVKNKTSVRNFKGSLVMIRHSEAGNHRLKSNAITGLAVDEVGGVAPYGWCSLTGKATYAPPGAEPVGNYGFQFYAEDRNQPGTGTDRIWIKVKDGSGAVAEEITISSTSAGAIAIDGGNVAIPHKPAMK